MRDSEPQPKRFETPVAAGICALSWLAFSRLLTSAGRQTGWCCAAAGGKLVLDRHGQRGPAAISQNCSHLSLGYDGTVMRIAAKMICATCRH